MKKIYVSKSKIAGKGLFAGENIKKGEKVFIIRGKRVKLNPKSYKAIFETPDWMGIGRCLCIDMKLPFLYINHSCNPNMGIKGKVTFVALKNIKKDDELTFDYSISEESMWQMKCNCGEKNCRKIVRSIQFLPENVYKKYLPNIPTYFQKVYQQSQNNKMTTKKQSKETIIEMFRKHCNRCKRLDRCNCCLGEANISFYNDEYENIVNNKKYIKIIRDNKKLFKKDSHKNIFYVKIKNQCKFLGEEGCKLEVKDRSLDCLSYPIFPIFETKKGKNAVVGLIVHKHCTSVEAIIKDKKLVDAIIKMWDKDVKKRDSLEMKKWFGECFREKKGEYLVL